MITRADLMARAERQQLRTIAAPAKRGDILDRRGRVLATSVDADTIYAVPSDISDHAAVVARLCDALGDCTDRERQGLADRLRRQKNFAYVRRQVSPDEAQRVADLNLEGIGFLKESRRFYPNRELGAHLLGYVGLDNNGLGGIEFAYDKQIRGKDGKVQIHTDARRRAFSRFERPSDVPTGGATFELTIDEYLQHIAERELHAGVVENRAAGGSAIVMNPRTGEILAMANEPTFNPNAYRDFPETHQRNRAVQDLYEPGSTFKIVTASAAIDENVMPIDTLIDTSPGVIRVGGDVIDEYGRHNYGVAVLRRRHRQVEQRRGGQDWVSGRGLPAQPVRAAVRVRPTDLARFPGRKSRHRLGSGEVDGPRARLGVDGLSGRRDTAADGGGRQLDCQWRRTRRAARRAGDVPRQSALRRPAEGASADRQPRDRRRDDDDHGTGRRRAEPRSSLRFPVTRSPEKRAPPRS